MKIYSITSDDKFIECAYISNADYIVSGDRHLLNLKSYKGIEILSARDLLIKIGRIYKIANGVWS